MIGAYVPGDSWLHRARPRTKLLALLVVSALIVLVPRVPVVLALAACVVAAVLAAGLGVRGLWALVRPMRWIVLVLTPFQWWSAGPERAFVVVGALVVAVVAAGLVTATTRVADMTDTFVTGLRPFVRFGLDPDRVGLALALTLRAVPVLSDALRQAGEARAARGLSRSPRALLVPVVVRAVRHAEAVGDALVARGVDDER